MFTYKKMHGHWTIITRLNIRNYTQDLENLKSYKEFLVDLATNIKKYANETIVPDLKALI